MFCFSVTGDPRDLHVLTHSFPTRRPSDLTAARVHVDGFKDRVGNLRVQAYGSDPSEFLESGKKIVRVEGEVSPAGKMSVCVPLPGPGTYAPVVLHDKIGRAHV